MIEPGMFVQIVCGMEDARLRFPGWTDMVNENRVKVMRHDAGLAIAVVDEGNKNIFLWTLILLSDDRLVWMPNWTLDVL